jgi:hypothetical protein
MSEGSPMKPRARASIIAVIPVVWLSCRSATSLRGPEEPIPRGCDIDGPAALAPAYLHKLKLGMSRAEAEALLGAPSYSPSPGQFYHSTGDGCRVGTEDQGMDVPCGFVVQYSLPSAQRLETCWWGPIAE